jgi:hypothetical protein
VQHRTKLIVGAALAAALTSACDRGPQAGLAGKWETEEAGAKTVATFERDSTFTMDFGEWKGEGRYTWTGENTLALTPQGSLKVSVPAGYEGTVEGDSLRLCVADRCSVYHRAK